MNINVSHLMPNRLYLNFKYIIKILKISTPNLILNPSLNGERDFGNQYQIAI